MLARKGVNGLKLLKGAKRKGKKLREVASHFRASTGKLHAPEIVSIQLPTGAEGVRSGANKRTNLQVELVVALED